MLEYISTWAPLTLVALLAAFCIMIHIKRRDYDDLSHQDIDWDAIIVGAGVIGSALAASLGRRGWRVLVLERDSIDQANDRIVGELLQPGGVRILEEQLELAVTLSEINPQTVHGYVVVRPGNHQFKLNYPHNARGFAFHNHRFVESLRRAANRWAPRVKLVQGTVYAVIQERGRVRGVQWRDPRTHQSNDTRAFLTIVCDGCFSSLRNVAALKPAPKISAAVSRFVGLQIDREASDDKKDSFASVHLISPGPVLLYPIDERRMRVLIDIPRGSVITGELRDWIQKTIAPQLPACIERAICSALEEGRKISTMPNQSMGATPRKDLRGIVMLGDSLNMRHPLTGAGMSVGLRDLVHFLDYIDRALLYSRLPRKRANADYISCSEMLAPLHLSFRDIRHLDAAIMDFYSKRAESNVSANILADALYQVFAGTRNKDLAAQCCAYLNRQGQFAAGPIALLAQTSTSQWLLTFHFFGVALFGMMQVLCGFDGVNNSDENHQLRIFRAYAMARDAVRILQPLLYRHQANWLIQATVSIAHALLP